MDSAEMNAVESGKTWLGHAVNERTLVGVSRGAFSVGVVSLLLGLGVSSLDINHDLAIAASSALRLTAGQRLYVDYSEPHGPIAGWVLALFTLVAPSVGWALVLASGALNVAVALLVWTVVFKSTRSVETALHAGLLTAVWFLPVFGGYYHDHLAYSLVIAAFACHTFIGERFKRAGLTALFFVLAYHTKQTVAIGGMLALAVTCLVVQGRRALFDRAHYLAFASFLMVFALSYALLFAAVDVQKYWFHAVRTPLAAASMDDTRNPLGLVYTLLYPFRMQVNFFQLPNPRTLFFIPVILLVYWSYFRLHRCFIIERVVNRAAACGSTTFVFVFMLLSSLWCSALLGRWSQEVTFGLWAALAIAWSTYRSAWVRHAMAALCGVLALPQIYANHPLEYPAHAFFTTTALRPISVRYSPNQYDLDGTVGVVEYLQGRPGSIAIIDEAAVLVPLALGRASWGPTSYLCDGLCIPRDPEGRAAWQMEFIDLLQRHHVAYVIRVNEFRYGYARGRVRGRDVYGLNLPILRRFVEEHYTSVFQCAGYEVLEFRGGTQVRSLPANRRPYG